MIPANLSKVLGRSGLILQKHSPTILTVVGLAAMTAGAVLAVKKTLQLEDTLLRSEERISDVKLNIEFGDNPEVETQEVYATQNDANKALFKAHFINVLDLTKLYGPAAGLFVGGIVSVAVGHGLMHKRNVALVAAYNVLEKSFAAYRARVLEDLGPDKDRDYRLGITEKTDKDKDGKKISEIEVDPTKMSPYARIFDQLNDNWDPEDLYNKFFLEQEQNWANDRLRFQGHLFLNEVYERLGFKKTTEGGLVGWLITDKSSDHYVDFGVYDASTQAKRNFVNGYEKSIWLDFNVDGLILDKI